MNAPALQSIAKAKKLFGLARMEREAAVEAGKYAKAAKKLKMKKRVAERIVASASKRYRKGNKKSANLVIRADMYATKLTPKLEEAERKAKDKATLALNYKRMIKGLIQQS